MPSVDVLKTLAIVKKSLMLEGAYFDKLIAKDIYIHKDLSDEQLTNFSGHALDLTIPDNLVENTMVVTENDYVCWKHNDAFYVMPASIVGVINNNDGKVGVWLDYKPTEMSDFISLEKG